MAPVQTESPGHRADQPSAITFSPFRLDLLGGRLLRHDQPVALRPKTWAVLVYLAERPGVLVAKETLLDAVWPDTAVSPDTLNKSIGELRVALGDNTRTPRFIETVHRRGFRFIAELVTPGRPLAARHAVAPAAGANQDDAAVFVGRTAELTRLGAMFAKSQEGERQIALITGPAGIGKTTLIDAFLDSPAVRDSVDPVWIGRAGCVEHHGPREAYLPVLEALEQLARRHDADRLLQLLQRAAPMWLVQMPWMVGETDMAAFQRSLHGVRAERMLREFAGLLELLTSNLTAVLVLEDLHWSDPSTVDLIAELGRRQYPARLLVIASYRPAELTIRDHVLATAVRSLQIQKRGVEIPLSDLSESAVHSYLKARFPGSDFPQSLSQRIHAHTSGDPLFMVAVVDHMRARGWILDTSPGWAITGPPASMDLGVPDDVRRMIEGQLYRLSPAEHELLAAASVAGQEVSVPLVAAALDCEVDDAELRCETLARTRRFLSVAGTTEWPDGTVTRRYAFTHELHRRVVYEGIPDGRCARLHQRVGDALEAAHGSQAVEFAAELAVHFERGRNRERALHYLAAAGERARQRFANREAIACFEPALELAVLVQDDATRQRWELELRLLFGRALSDLHGFTAEPVRANYARAAELCAAVGTAAQRVEVLYARWYYYALRAERNAALAAAAELADLVAGVGAVEYGILADTVLLRTALYDGRFAEARNAMSSLRTRQQPAPSIGAPISYGVDPVIAANLQYAIALWFLGEPDAAATAAGDGIALARESRNPFFLSAGLVQAAIVALLCRDPAAGSGFADEAFALSAEQEFAYWNTYASGLRGWALIQQGRAGEGAALVEQAIARMHAAGARFFSAFFLAALAEGRLQTGEVAAGLAAAEEALQVTQTTLDRSYEAEIWRLKGELLGQQATAEVSRSGARGTKNRRSAVSPSAQECFERALDTARTMKTKALELRAATSLARAWQARGRAVEARAMLNEVYGWFGAEVESVDLVHARRLLEELGPHIRGNKPAIR